MLDKNKVFEISHPDQEKDSPCDDKPFIKITSRAIFNDMNSIKNTLKNFNKIGEALTHITNFEKISEARKQMEEAKTSTRDRNQKVSYRPSSNP